MSEVHKIIIQTRAPKGKDPGKVAIGYYCIADGHVVPTDEKGKPSGAEKRFLNPGDDARLIACRMLRKRQSASSGWFNEPIRYPKLKY
jgi:hypothetical protein